MALSETKKLEKKRKWVVVSGDASLRYGEILSYHKTEDEAYARRVVFSDVRLETVDEVKERLATAAAR